MIRRALGGTGYDISAVVYGGIVSMNDGQESSDRYVAWAVEQGVNYFDIAPSYGDAQEKLGNSLIPYRKNIYLACKTGQRMRREAEKEMKRSLAMLHTDCFDVYQMHGISSMEDVDRAFGPGGVMELMREMKEKGIARKIGITAHSEDAALKALDLYDFDTVLFPFNWHMFMAHGMGERLLKTAKERGIGLLCMKSMIERAWIDEAEKRASGYPKSWCKPFDTQTQAELLTAAVKFAYSLGVDAIVPPGNFDHFSFAVKRHEELLTHPFCDADRALLPGHLEKVKDYPFFGV